MGVTPGFWRGRRVLVTGHTGFKGSWLTLWLHEMGAEVSGFALAPETEPSLFRLASLEQGIRSVEGDIRDADALASGVRDAAPEIVFHLAAQSLVRRSYADPVGTYATNVLGTVHLLDAVRRVGSASAVVVVTSDKCYENREWEWPYRESDALGGHDPYSSSKACAELATSAYRRSYFGGAAGGARVGIATARAGNVVGGGDWAEDRIVPDAVRAFSAGAELRVRRPQAVRPWQHVLEPLSGYLRLAEGLATGEAVEGAWNFGPGEEGVTPVAEIVERVRELWGDGARWAANGPASVHEAGMLQLDSSLARRTLGWKPRLALAEALEWTVEWYRAQLAGADARDLTLSQISRYRQLRA